ncbi:MAG: DUF167 domain-containing protein [Nitrospirota bacterium]
MIVPFKRSNKGIVLKIKVQPRSSKKGISAISDNTIKVCVNAPPAGGAANGELIEILSEAFDIKKTAIKIIRGKSSKDKIVEIQGIDSIK